MYDAYCLILIINQMGAFLPGGLKDNRIGLIGIDRPVRLNRRGIDDGNIEINTAQTASQTDHDVA